MLTSGSWNNRPFTINLKPNCLIISFDSPTQALVFTYDLSGRLWSMFARGTTYRRGLDGRILAKSRLAGQERQRRWLPCSEARALERYAQESVLNLLDGLRSGHIAAAMPLLKEAATIRERIRSFDDKRSRLDVEHYHSIYKPLGILPPDQYLAVVLQATEGCSFNTCTFCDLYRASRFRIKPLDEFRQHAEAVDRFLGDGSSLRRSIFLGDANALVIPMARLLPLLDVARGVFEEQAERGIFAFLDGFSGEKKSVADYRTLRTAGLRRVYIGLESGSQELLSFLRKPGKPRDAVNAVRAMKEGALSVGVIVLLGAGGDRYAESHVRDSAAAITAMSLDKDDILYFSELVADETLPYARQAAQAGLRPLSHEERLAQGESIRNQLTFANDRDAPRISRYDIREFIY